MTYNVYIQSDNGETSFLDITLQHAEKIANAFTVNYTEYGFKRIYRIAFLENNDGHSFIENLGR